MFLSKKNILENLKLVSLYAEGKSNTDCPCSKPIDTDCVITNTNKCTSKK